MSSDGSQNSSWKEPNTGNQSPPVVCSDVGFKGDAS
uniref:Uncharacterized protein n=1 Tax=Setaria italica TaxID=4555 RepID=K4ANG5_SETIT